MNSTTTLIQSLKTEGIIANQRERSATMYWLTDGTQRFLSFHKDEVVLWHSRRPYFVNEKLATLPMEQATATTIACMI